MPSNLQVYSQMADHAATQITGSHLEWTAFLTTAARLYKYPYNEQLMIHAQRPDATACAEYDVWNEKMRRYVRRGSKGIAIIDASGDRPKLKYVFDVSDTGGRDNSRRPFLWELRDEHIDAVTAMLERQYEVSGANGLADQLERIAAQMADEYWNDNQYDILRIVDDSFLEEYDDFNIGVQFRSAANVSITYSLMSRCGLHPEEYFEHEDFLNIFDFNTPSTVAALGTAVSEANQRVLRQIEVTIKNYEREHIAERTAEYGEQPDIHTQRGLPDSRPDALGAAGSEPRQVREDAEAIPSGASESAVEQPDSLGEAVPAPVGDRADGAEPLGADHAEAGGGGGRDGDAQSGRPDEMGWADEQLQGAGGGNDTRGAYLQLKPPYEAARGDQLSLFPSEASQIQAIAEAEELTPSAFSISPADIDAELRNGTAYSDGKLRVYGLYQHSPAPKEAIKFLKEEYGYFGHSHTFLDGTAGFVNYSANVGMKINHYGTKEETTLKWSAVDKRLRALVNTDSYLTPEEKTKYAELEREYAGLGGVPMPIARYGFPKPEAVKADPAPEAASSRLSDIKAHANFTDLIAAYEEVFSIPSDERIVSWYGDYHLWEIKHGTPDEKVVEVFDKGIATLGISQDEYFENGDYTYRGNVIRDMCAHNNLPAPQYILDQQPETTARELFERYKPVVAAAVEADEAYRNACRNSDRENAYIEGAAAVRRVVLASDDLELIRLYSDVPEFHTRLETEVLDATYPKLHYYLQPISQEDIDGVLRDWHNDPETKRAIVQYMADHARDKDTAAWLAQVYGGADSKSLHITRTGTDEVVELPWTKVQRRIAQLIKEDRFFDDVEKAEQLTSEATDGHAEQIPSRYQVVVYHHFENGFDERLEYQTLQEAEKVARGYVAGTMEPDGFAYDGAAVYDLQERQYLRIFGDYPDENAQAQVKAHAEQTIAAEPISPEAPTVQPDPLAPPYKTGDTVYLDDKPFEITEVNDSHVQLRDPSLYYPIFRAENRENFERLLQRDIRNGAITEMLPAELDMVDTDLQDALTGDGGLLSSRDKDIIGGWLRNGEGNTRIAQRLSETYAGTAETMMLTSGEDADYTASTTSFEIDIRDKYNTHLSFRWQEIAPVLRAMYQQERDGFSHTPIYKEPVTLGGEASYQVGDKVTMPVHDHDISGTIGHIGDKNVRIDTGPYSWSREVVNREQFDEAIRHDERNAELFTPARETVKPETRTETVAVYPAERNNLPYDIVIQTLHTEPEHTPPTIAPADNFHITDDALGVGGAKVKFRMNMDAINLLKELELDGRQATPEEQAVLSRYVGWGGLPDAFDENKPAWKNEFQELYAALSPEEYAAARSSTLNAHYTSPTVIKAIYEAVGSMGFQTGNILEPSMGVGNFFGCLPEKMRGSKLYGVELDSLTGRIAKQLYPQADITVAGFETTDRRDFYDLAVGNVPFGQYSVNDRAYNKLGFSIHNYFFAKALDQVRPGGVIAFVTSRYTMDAKDETVRKYLAQRADFLGAIRLPNNAFRVNAGTDVVSDIIFLQKRDRPIEIDADWIHLGENDDGFALNSYFIDHPEMILGRQTSESTQYGGQDFTVAPIEGLELADQLHDAVKYIGGQYTEAELPDLGEGEAIDTSIPADPDVKNYSYTVVDGEVYFRENSRMVKPELNATAIERVKGMVELRDCVNDLIDLQMNEYAPNAAIKEKQIQLNQIYDEFSAKYGLINDRGNRLAFSDDSSYYLLCSLEVLDDDGNLERKADMFTKRTIKQQRSVEHVDTASEALAVSIGERAEVDLPYMAQLTGKTVEEITADLRGVIYKDPAYGSDPLAGWKTADEYLSGNVRQKLSFAQSAAEYDPAFQVNVEALTLAQPKDLDASEIEVRLGATWIDKKYIQQFMEETFETPRYLRGTIEVTYVPYTAEWQVSSKNSVRYNDVAAFTTYGADRANAYRLLEDSLNLRDIRIYDTVEDESGHERRVLNAKETTLAAQKQQLIRDAFKDWIWRDPERRQTLVRQYNEEMNSTRPREYDGGHIVFSGMNPAITLLPHQRNAVAHVLYGGNTLLAHEVGAGKTFEMVAAAMESKRLGLCQKSIFVVPNHLTEQWASEFLRLYPSANILVTTKKDFETHNRKKFCGRIATGDYDAVIIGFSQFERIPISPERQKRLLDRQIEEITAGIQEVKSSGSNSYTVKSLERTKKGLEARLEKLQADSRKDDVVTFEQLGCDRMFVDESDNYKNLFLYTKMRNVAGLSTTDAQKSSDMYAKCRYMDELTGNRGIVFATGTPISNSMTEMYTIQRYLQHDRLQELGMGHFDCWASRFGETVTALELAPEGYNLIGR